MATKVFKDSTQSIPGKIITYNVNTGAILNIVETSFTRKSFARADANWHRRKPPPPLVLYPTSLDILETDTAKGAYSGDRPYIGYYRQRYENTNPANDPGPQRTVTSQASNAAQASIKAGAVDNFANGSLNLGESLAESRETINMIRNRAIQVYRILRATRKGDWKGLSDALKGPVPGKLREMSVSKRLASGHLEVEYGWKPLLGDIQGGLEHLRDRAAFSEEVYRKGQKRYFERDDNSDPRYAGSYSASLAGQIGNPQLAELSRLGLTNPFLIAWNLLPFSFVIDWFVPVSSFLSAFHAGHGFTAVVGCTVNTVTRSTLKGNSETDYRKTVARRPWAYAGIFSLDPTAVGRGLNADRALNALALIESLRPGGPRRRR